ncbi:hypothetical protein ACYBYS_25330 [Klebsiella pneumoniae]|uniref:hypothetical protein n=1 Tax=Klebsiella pneumoniae TaxID=573 RepID=UPI00146BED3C|nr:hypothetical protein [Klebsiella pneumoniae]EIY1370658.1 hypothetical protein [Klebsiella pneumoniae]EIY1381123.1 hypothetical protein [Klebsiella pneumoniae]EIY1404007.1 hypothetical protein [Klebsiella pneumoniae]EIY1415631.1 hypothetical protein [Klebsiella pneumoniae]EIY1447707.1 hypothetical protein [Klebsiella pneumoniae]
MMFNRNELTISMFYASTTDADSNRIATITLQVNDTEGSPVQSSQLLCVTDKAGKKTYSVGEQSTKNGSDPLLVAIENYWRQNTPAVTGSLMSDVTDFITGNVNQSSTWVGFNGLKIFDGVQLDTRLPESVLQADGSSATATGS